MIIPVRCFTCNKVIGHMWNDYVQMVEEQRSKLGTDSDATAERYFYKHSSWSTGTQKILLQKNAFDSCESHRSAPELQQ